MVNGDDDLIGCSVVDVIWVVVGLVRRGRLVVLNKPFFVPNVTKKLGSWYSLGFLLTGISCVAGSVGVNSAAAEGNVGNVGIVGFVLRVLRGGLVVVDERSPCSFGSEAFTVVVLDGLVRRSLLVVVDNEAWVLGVVTSSSTCGSVDVGVFVVLLVRLVLLVLVGVVAITVLVEVDGVVAISTGVSGFLSDCSIDPKSNTTDTAGSIASVDAASIAEGVALVGLVLRGLVGRFVVVLFVVDSLVLSISTSFFIPFGGFVRRCLKLLSIFKQYILNRI